MHQLSCLTTCKLVTNKRIMMVYTQVIFSTSEHHVNTTASHGIVSLYDILYFLRHTCSAVVLFWLAQFQSYQLDRHLSSLAHNRWNFTSCEKKHQKIHSINDHLQVLQSCRTITVIMATPWDQLKGICWLLTIRADTGSLSCHRQ